LKASPVARESQYSLVTTQRSLPSSVDAKAVPRTPSSSLKTCSYLSLPWMSASSMPTGHTSSTQLPPRRPSNRLRPVLRSSHILVLPSAAPSRLFVGASPSSSSASITPGSPTTSRASAHADTRTASDFIVAMNSPQYQSDAHCGQKIQIQINDKSAIAEVVDECPGCGYDNLDFSEGLFKHFGNTQEGTLYGSWSFIDGKHSGSKKHHSRNFFVSQQDTTPPMTTAQFLASVRSVLRRWTTSGLAILKRHNNARFTYYETGLGARGHHSKPSDSIVAMNTPQYQSGAHCGQKVKIEVSGKSAISEVVGNLDLSERLFRHFANTKEGVLYGSWSFVDENHDTSRPHHSRAFVSGSVSTKDLRSIFTSADAIILVSGSSTIAGACADSSCSRVTQLVLHVIAFFLLIGFRFSGLFGFSSSLISSAWCPFIRLVYIHHIMMHLRQSTSASITNSPPLLFGLRFFQLSFSPFIYAIAYRLSPHIHILPSTCLSCYRPMPTDSADPFASCPLPSSADHAQAAVKIRPGRLRPLDYCLRTHLQYHHCYIRVSASPSRKTTITMSSSTLWVGTQKGQRNCAPPTALFAASTSEGPTSSSGWSMTRSSHSILRSPSS
jgi:hypothetical protein